MTAALVCALQGLDVLLCEKSSQVGGTTATSAGTIWVPGTRQAREAGFKDDIPEARRYLDSIIGPATDGRREAYLATGPELVDYLARNSEVKFSLYARHPDYLSNRPGTTLAGRALAPLPFDGRLLGADFALLRPPIGEFMALGGMMIGRDDIEPLARPFASAANFRRALSLIWRHATDRLRHRRGTRLLMGNALAARLFYSLRRRKVPVWLNASLRELTSTDGRVTGAVLSVDGETRRVTARRGVVLATGGIGGSVERLNDYVRPPLKHAVAFAGAAGDGMRVARAAGAGVEDDHASPAFWTPVSETGWLKGGRGAYPHLALDRAKPGLIAVNAAGLRFVDEAVSYHEFVIGMHRSHETVPTIPAWLVCDRAFRRTLRPRPRAARAAKLAQADRRAAIWSKPIRSMRSPRKSRSMRPVCATAWRETTAPPRPASTRTSARARPISTATTAIPATSRTPASARSRRRRITRWRSIPARSDRASGSRPTPTAACCLQAARRSRASTPAATTWLRSCAGIIPVPASRSGRAWCSPIAPRWPSPETRA